MPHAHASGFPSPCLGLNSKRPWPPGCGRFSFWRRDRGGQAPALRWQQRFFREITLTKIAENAILHHDGNFLKENCLECDITFFDEFPCDQEVAPNNLRRPGLQPRLPVSYRRARETCPSPGGDRGGNPLGCADGIRGPPRYEKKRPVLP